MGLEMGLEVGLEVGAVRRKVAFLTVLGALLTSMFAGTGAVPSQGERPPQPFYQDFFSGRVTLQGQPAPAGLQLLACVGDCLNGFESEPIELEEGGRFTLLEVKPTNELLIGVPVSFYIVNEFGRIRAEQTKAFIGVYDSYTLDLTFVDSLPAPTPIPTITPTVTLTPTAVLPVPGDPGVTAIPRLAMIIGAGAFAMGGVLVLLARRRAEA